MVLSNLFSFPDLLVEFRCMAGKLGENLFPNYMLHFTLTKGEIVLEDR